MPYQYPLNTGSSVIPITVPRPYECAIKPAAPAICFTFIASVNPASSGFCVYVSTLTNGAFDALSSHVLFLNTGNVLRVNEKLSGCVKSTRVLNMITRRQFLLSASTLAFIGLSRSAFGKVSLANLKDDVLAYGPLVPDVNKLFDLPQGFSYQVISQLGDKMDDGLAVPDKADGMGCIALDSERVALIRNHELTPKNISHCLFTSKPTPPRGNSTRTIAYCST